MRSKEEDTKILWEKRCGFVDISIGELYAHLCDSLSRYHWPYEKVMVDVEISVGDKTFDTGRVLVLGELECPGSVCSLLGGARQNRLSNKNVGVGDFEFSVCDMGKGLHIYPKTTFDCVFSVHGVEEHSVIINEFFRVLQSSGHLILVESPTRSGEETRNILKGRVMRRT